MPSKKIKLFIVEDDQTLQETLAYNLNREGYEVTRANDGVSALNIARDVEPDLILLDIMLPELDGLTVCRTLRRESNVSIALLTARGGEVDRIIGLDCGADDYIVKRFSLGELYARLRAVMRRKGNEHRYESRIRRPRPRHYRPSRLPRRDSP